MQDPSISQRISTHDVSSREHTRPRGLAHRLILAKYALPNVAVNGLKAFELQGF